METPHENLDPNQSLSIITKMIQEAKGSVQNNAVYFLLWGWVVAIGNFGMYALMKLAYPAPYMIWLITIPAAFISMYLGYRQGKNRSVTTHLGTIYMWTWVSFAIVIFTLILFGQKINYQFNPIILLITSLPTFISGISLRFKPLVIGGILFWIFGIVSFTLNYELQLLIGGLAIICGYLIPGYLLRNKKD